MVSPTSFDMCLSTVKWSELPAATDLPATTRSITEGWNIQSMRPSVWEFSPTRTALNTVLLLSQRLDARDD